MHSNALRLEWTYRSSKHLHLKQLKQNAYSFCKSVTFVWCSSSVSLPKGCEHLLPQIWAVLTKDPAEIAYWILLCYKRVQKHITPWIHFDKSIEPSTLGCAYRDQFYGATSTQHHGRRHASSFSKLANLCNPPEAKAALVFHGFPNCSFDLNWKLHESSA